jgi:hypothetical protein
MPSRPSLQVMLRKTFGVNRATYIRPTTLVNFRRKRSNAFLTLLLLLLLRLNSSPQSAHWNLDEWLRIHSSGLRLSLPQCEQRMRRRSLCARIVIKHSLAFYSMTSSRVLAAVAAG